MRWHKMGWDAVHREPNATAWLRSWPRDTQTLRHKAAKAKSSAILAPLCTQYGDSTASTCASGAGDGAGAEVGAQAKVKARSELMLDWLWVHLHLFGSVWFWFGWVLCAVCSGAGAVADATATASPTASAANWTGERCTVFTWLPSHVCLSIWTLAVCLFVGWSVGWLVGCLVGLFVCFPGECVCAQETDWNYTQLARWPRLSPIPKNIPRSLLLLLSVLLFPSIFLCALLFHIHRIIVLATVLLDFRLSHASRHFWYIFAAWKTFWAQILSLVCKVQPHHTKMSWAGHVRT